MSTSYLLALADSFDVAKQREADARQVISLAQAGTPAQRRALNRLLGSSPEAICAQACLTIENIRTGV